MQDKKNILIAPLNWGLGHATRCIPIINNLINSGYNVIIASDGEALCLLKKEFPKLIFEELPAYNIMYKKNNIFLKWHLLLQIPKLRKVIRKERKITQQIIDKYQIDILISDNRFGVNSNKIPSIYLTHQLRVLSGFTTYFTTKVHQIFYNKYNQIWVPDYKGRNNLSGKLSHGISNKKVKYIGVLSRFNKQVSKKKYDVLAVLSGPEPQRSMLENKLLIELQKYNAKVALVQGVLTEKKSIIKNKNIDIYNYLTSVELEKLIAVSDIIISRSGYTSIMDYFKLEKKVFFIPTPGQYEQEYLAKYLKNNKIAPFCKQSDFEIEKLAGLSNYYGFIHNKTKQTDDKNLLNIKF